MKIAHFFRFERHAPAMPRLMHAMELIIGLVIIAGGQGLLGVIVSAADDITPPSVPANLIVTGRSATTVEIAWDVSTDDVAVTGYEVFRNGTQVGSSASNSYTDTGLVPNTGYTYTVSAYDAQNNISNQSAALITSTLADTLPPSVPANVRQTGSTISTISIAWNASSDNVGVTNYEIYRNGSQVRTQSGTTYTDTGLAVFSTYTYNVIARDAAGNTSNLSVSLNASTAQDITAPSVPDNLHKLSSTVSSITLEWNASTDDVGTIGYRIYRSGSLIGTTAGTTYTNTGLNPSTGYTYTVSAYDAAGNSSLQSQPFNTASSDDTTAPTIPSNVQATNTFDTSVVLAWNASTDDVAVTGYKVYRDGILVGTTSSLTITDTGLSPVTTYGYTVQAYDVANNTSAASAVLNVQTAYDTTAPSIPTNVISTNQTDSTISLSWNTSTDNVAVSGYDVYRNGTLITTTMATSFTDSGLLVDTDYTYRVRAHDAYGNNSAQSVVLATGTIPDMIAPASPTNLTPGSKSTTTADFIWNASTDDVAVTGYKVYRDGIFIQSLTATNFADSLLRYNRQYSYTVTAVDFAGNESAQSLPLLMTTDPDITAPSITITAPSSGQTDVKFTILLAANASDDLDLNRVEYYAGTTLIGVIRPAPYAFNWDTYAVKNGAHQITAKAIDATGNASSQSVTITINNPPPPLRGDINGDFRVNIFDLSLLLSRFNKSGKGDFNNNGRVDIFDLSVLLGQYGKDNNYR